MTPRTKIKAVLGKNHTRSWQAGAVATLLVMLVTIPISLATQPEQRRTDPLVFQDLDGREVRLEGERDRTAILIFGELYHKKTAQACKELLLIRADPRFATKPPELILVVSQDLPAAELKAKAASGTFPKVIIQDTKRRAFGAFRVVVLPTVAVLGRDGSIVHSMPGFSSRLADLTMAAVLRSENRLSSKEFQDALHPTPEPEINDQERRAARLTRLADQLQQKNMDDLAQQRYEDALELVPSYLDAHIGLGNLFLYRRQLSEAEKQFAIALETKPDSTAAALGMAFVQALRGGDQAEKARNVAHEILTADPKNPQAHYLLGLLAEQADEYKEATTKYKMAAELLMGRPSLTDKD